MERPTRRQVVTGAAALMLGVANDSPDLGLATAEASQATAGGDDWIELECAMKETTLDGHRVRLRAYNDQIPGPTINVTPGQTLRVRLKNSLPPYDSSAWDGNLNVPHELGHTSLHLHGMDVVPHMFEPVGTSDPLALMIAVPPGGSYEYVFQIPEDHSSGLNWYHPHKHGATAVQAMSGMAGGLIVTGAIDEVPEIKAAREITLVMQDIGLFPSEEDPNLWTYDPVQNAIWVTGTGEVTIKGEKTDLKGGFSGGDFTLHYYLLNGQPYFKETHNDADGSKPLGTQLDVQRFTMAPGEVVRFRMLNGNAVTLMPIIIEGHDIHLIALDGVNFPNVRTIPATTDDSGDGQLLLAQANRAEFLIKASMTPGIYRIRQLAQDQQFLASQAKVIAEIEVTGEANDMALPDGLPTPSREYPLITPEEIKRVRLFEFSDQTPAVINTVVGSDFYINNSLYGETEVPTVVNRDDAEEWHIIVGDSTHGGSEGHSFHIHVNSFEVISLNGVEQPAGTIQDTVWVAENTTAVIRIRFKEFVGKSVYHCHILPHEDTGMMQNFLIVDPDS